MTARLSTPDSVSRSAATAADDVRTPMKPGERRIPHEAASRVCGARTRQGGICRNRAGYGVPGSAGVGPCKFHGGAGAIATLKHGRYSKLLRPRIRELLDQSTADPRPLDVLEDLQLARALTHDFLDRAESGAAHPREIEVLGTAVDKYVILLGDEATPAQREQIAEARAALATLAEERAAPDVPEAVRCLAEISKMAHRVEQLRTAGAFSLQQVHRFLLGVDRVLQLHIADEERRAAIRRDINAIRV